MGIYKDISQLIGKTPMVSLERYGNQENLHGEIVVKLEAFNPQGSVKDRAALYMLNGAEEEGKLDQDTVIIEPTSGNTGIGLAYIAAIRGYSLILTMPDTMSVERQKLLKAFGASIVLTEGKLGMKGAIDKAEELAKTYPKAFIPSQFTNAHNAMAHKQTTAIEILHDTEGKMDYFVAGVGSGGTITGVGEVLKEKSPRTKIIAVEPEESPVLSEGTAGPHGIQGIGAGFVPQILNKDIIDHICTVSTKEALETAKKLRQTEGILAGISGGAALYAATKIANREDSKGKRIVVLLPDTGERYLSTSLFDFI